MAELKTKVTNQSVAAFVKAIEPKEKRADATDLLRLFKMATGLTPKLWGDSIIGFGSYHYVSERSAQKGDWPLTGFSPRKQNLTIYIMPGFKEYGDILKDLGKYKISGGSCLYIKKLSDVNEKLLIKLIKRSVADMKKRHPSK